MTVPKLHQPSESAKLSGLDLIVKYAVLLSWLVYAAGLTKISGFLRTLSIPTEPSTYALPTVLSYGAYSLLALLETSGIPIVLIKLFEKQTPRQLWRFIGWTLPAGIFAAKNYSVFWSNAPVLTRSYYAISFLAAAYTLVYLFSRSEVYEPSAGTQVLLAAVLFFLVAEGSGYKGDLEAYDARNNPPSIQFLLAPDAVSGANKLGIAFNPSEPGLTVPLNVVAFSEKMFYVRIPLRLDASQVQNGVQLDWERQITVAIPRDKVIMASTHR
jgi:hypothetical protein